MSASLWSCLACCLIAAPLQGTPATPQANPPSNPVTARLKAQFDAADLDHNTYLDMDELAKVFRGPKAKKAPQGIYDDEGKLSKAYREARQKYPDLLFLANADTNADELVSWPEFQTYERKLLKAQQQQQQALQRMLASANRRSATRSSRPYHPVYRGHRSSTYSHPVRHTQYLQRSQNTQQAQMIRAVQNWQNNQRAMQAAYLRMVQQRMQAQQRVLNYVRQRQGAYYRAVQQHALAVQRAQLRRRR